MLNSVLKTFRYFQGILNDGQVVGHKSDLTAVRLVVEEFDYCAFMLPRVFVADENEEPARVDVEMDDWFGHLAPVKISYRFKNAPVIHSKLWVAGGMRPLASDQTAIRKNWKEISEKLMKHTGSVFDGRFQRPKFNRCPVAYSHGARRFLAIVPQSVGEADLG